ncbi:MAG: hypothetical protein JSV84_06355 [Gemmatimonadota bacterium]|nr:MAG: hypothetical protein JSV84_06355 [Gemmatimonadota bacterium]
MKQKRTDTNSDDTTQGSNRNRRRGDPSRVQPKEYGMAPNRHLCLNLLLIIFTTSSFACGQSPHESPQRIYRYCYSVQSKEWYKKQEILWKNEIGINPQNEDAWYNYFFAARYGWANVEGQTETREALLDSIYSEMGKAIPDSWVYHYIHYYNYGTDFSRLEKAYGIHPGEPDLYWEFMKEYEMTGNKEKKKEFCTKLYRSKAISPGILNFNYNMLISAQENAILIVNGDNDTYPAWILQVVKEVREDILILNIHAIFGNRSYLQSKLREKGIEFHVSDLSDVQIPSFLERFIRGIHQKYPHIPIHLARTLHQGYYANFRDDLSLTGLVYTFRVDPSDKDALHQDIVENKLRLDYLDHDWYSDVHVSEPLVKQLNLHYVEPFVKLADYLNSQGNIASARKWSLKALILAQRADDQSLIQKIQSRFK